VSTRLQQRGIDLVAALAEIDNTVSILNAWREEATSVFLSLYCELTEKVEAVGLPLSCPRCEICDIDKQISKLTLAKIEYGTVTAALRVSIRYAYLTRIIPYVPHMN